MRCQAELFGLFTRRGPAKNYRQAENSRSTASQLAFANAENQFITPRFQQPRRFLPPKQDLRGSDLQSCAVRNHTPPNLGRSTT